MKNNKFDLLVSCFPIGQKGKGGHNHLDTGSFALSIKGTPFILDPGSYCYSMNKKERDRFRSYTYHNTIYNLIDKELNLEDNGFWRLKQYYDFEVIYFNDKVIELKIKFINDSKYRFRKFELFKNKLVITDQYEGNFFSRFNLNPFHERLIMEGDKITIMDEYKISIEKKVMSSEIKIYDYSPHYGKKEVSKYLEIQSEKIIKIEIE